MNEKQQKYSRKVIEIEDFMYKYPKKKISEVISVFCGKFRKSSRMIENYMKDAREYNSVRLQREEKKREKVQDDAKIMSLQSAILTRNESLEILSKISKGNVRKVGEDVIIPSDADRTRAIQQLSKMQGWETERVDVTTNGRDINSNSVTEIIFIDYGVDNESSK